MESHRITNKKCLEGFLLVFLFLNFSLFSVQKKIELEIDKILELGKEDLLFGSIASVCEDEDHNFYVLDRSEHKVLKFSPEGKLILTFGQKGQGPGDIFSIQGEFQGSAQVAGKPIFLSERYMYFDRSDPDGNLYLEKSTYRIITE